MSGTNHYYGDNVNMYGGRNNQGIVKNQGGPGAGQQDPALAAALAELNGLVARLRTQVPAPDAQLLDESLPAVSPDAAVPAQERHRALMAIAGIAATVGAVGRPVAEAVRAVIGMISG
ncbi:hypothetical protein GCM10010260_66800 [Streptomyces filipinensis]|uniref:Uncharacterized protein n=1 Tax=Streptomyces filipinensis TaxID=66887 RepID=A0A918IIK9_9ACTN|nr:hypothetical protein [Streptomyces filipinensis]GGV17793.1 hypothetical protein GCM10010260_66800 [Streptomyces filipinensis]